MGWKTHKGICREKEVGGDDYPAAEILTSEKLISNQLTSKKPRRKTPVTSNPIFIMKPALLHSFQMNTMVK
ncbi:MAG: hypothetical protein HS132_10985 [Planctomycetia bacterium]|nr:hypothetical protein [Planctomycetia bacterium]